MTPLNEQQRLFLIDSSQLYEAYEQAYQQALAHKYGMKWKTARGKEYLFRASSADGYGRSLGVRSPETEKTYEAFCAGKIRADERYAAIKKKISDQARLNRAVRLGRMPKIVSDILNALAQSEARNDFRLVGTHALWAYESMAAVQFTKELLASGDVDLLYDPRKKLSLISKRMENSGLMGLLRKADKTFEPMKKNGFRAVNDDGFMVDLIIPERAMWDNEIVQFAEDDLVAAEVPSLKWLCNAPVEEVVVIAANGMPVRLRVPDPRAFMVHKAWLSQQANRNPVKKQRDLMQAELVFQALREYLPNYPIQATYLRYLPRPLVQDWIAKHPTE